MKSRQWTLAELKRYLDGIAEPDVAAEIETELAVSDSELSAFFSDVHRHVQRTEQASLSDLHDYLEGTAGPAAKKRVEAAVNDSSSDLSVLFAGLRKSIQTRCNNAQGS